MSKSSPAATTPGAPPGGNATSAHACFGPRNAASSFTGSACSRGPAGVARSVNSTGTVICWLNGMPGNVT